MLIAEVDIVAAVMALVATALLLSILLIPMRSVVAAPTLTLMVWLA